MKSEDESRGIGNKKLTKSKSGLRIIPISNTARSPFELKEPTWSPDKEVRDNCQPPLSDNVWWKMASYFR